MIEVSTGGYGTPVMVFFYRNWKGEQGYRRVVNPKIVYKESKYHKGMQFIIEAFDIDKQDFRDFAMCDIIEYIREDK